MKTQPNSKGFSKWNPLPKEEQAIEEILSLKEERKQGYSTCPGHEHEQQKLFTCRGLRWRYNSKTKNVEFAIIESREPGQQTQYKFPGGGSELGETAYAVLYRELFEETPFRDEFAESKENIEMLKNSSGFYTNGEGRTTNYTLFFLIKNPVQNVELENFRPDTDRGEIYRLLWVDAQKCANTLYKQNREALFEAIEILRMISPEAGYALMNMQATSHYEEVKS